MTKGSALTIINEHMGSPVKSNNQTKKLSLSVIQPGVNRKL